MKNHNSKPETQIKKGACHLLFGDDNIPEFSTVDDKIHREH
jgi:hypothetical protein